MLGGWVLVVRMTLRLYLVKDILSSEVAAGVPEKLGGCRELLLQFNSILN